MVSRETPLKQSSPSRALSRAASLPFAILGRVTGARSGRVVAQVRIGSAWLNRSSLPYVAGGSHIACICLEAADLSLARSTLVIGPTKEVRAMGWLCVEARGALLGDGASQGARMCL
jgi:hypothetical protein